MDIRVQRVNLLLIIQHHHIIPPDAHVFVFRDTQRLQQKRRRRDGLGSPGRKIQRQPFTATCNSQRANKSGSKMDTVARIIQMFKDDMSSRQRGMPTQIDLSLRGKPAQLKAVFSGDKIGRF